MWSKRKNNWSFILFIALLNHACSKLPELLPRLKTRECKEIKGFIKLQKLLNDPKSYTITLDSLAEEVKTLEWKIDNVILKDTAKSFTHSFSTPGEHSISVKVTDYCSKNREINKKLSICETLKGVISFKPIETEKGYYIWIDSLKGSINKVLWFVNGKKLTNNKIDLGGNKSLTVTYEGARELALWSHFSDDGDYNLLAEVQDSCGNILQAKKTLNVKTTYVNIPDVNFEQKLISLGIDNDNQINGRIWEGDALKVKDLNVAGPSGPSMGNEGNASENDDLIKSIQGIEEFKNLERLDISRNRITAVSFKNLTGLKFLNCSSNPISALDLQYNTQLTELYCHKINIPGLVLTKNVLLESLFCEFNNLVSLDVGQNLKLKELDCGFNNISNLDVAKNTALTKLICYSNKINYLNLTKNTALVELNCTVNNLSNLDVSKNLNLASLSCSLNNIQKLNLSANKNLDMLVCYGNGLTNLDMTPNTLLTYLDCGANSISTLNLSKNISLKTLHCGFNKLSLLDISKNIELTLLTAIQNPSLYTICVHDVAKVKSNLTFEKNAQAEFVKCN